MGLALRFGCQPVQHRGMRGETSVTNKSPSSIGLRGFHCLLRGNRITSFTHSMISVCLNRKKKNSVISYCSSQSDFNPHFLVRLRLQEFLKPALVIFLVWTITSFSSLFPPLGIDHRTSWLNKSSFTHQKRKKDQVHFYESKTWCSINLLETLISKKKLLEIFLLE